jgi:hypothetical protein
MIFSRSVYDDRSRRNFSPCPVSNKLTSASVNENQVKFNLSKLEDMAALL